MGIQSQLNIMTSILGTNFLNVSDLVSGAAMIAANLEEIGLNFSPSLKSNLNDTAPSGLSTGAKTANLLIADPNNIRRKL